MTPGPGTGSGPGRPARTIAAAVMWVRVRWLVTQTASRGRRPARPENAASLSQSQTGSVWP